MVKERHLHTKRIRKIRIHFGWRGGCYSFCWIEFLQNGSFSLGFLSKIFKFTEYGSAIARSGHFTEHTKILTCGNIDVTDAESPHITIHPPKVGQKTGIVHMTAKNGIVDEFQLDWFPVNKIQPLMYIFTGDIAALDKTTKRIPRYQIVLVPSNLRCLRMELIIYPRSPKYPKPATIIHVPKAIGNIHGGCPYYMVSCYFYGNDLTAPAFYLASDS
jgi:hypothetical protein